MSTPRATRIVAVVVTLASAAAGGWFGELAHFLYSLSQGAPHLLSDAAVGAAAGLLVGLGWVALMRWAGGGGARRRVVSWGALGGLAAGGVATLLLHAVLGLTHAVNGSWLEAVLIGEAFGLTAGAALGLLGGLGWFVTLRLAGART